MRADQQNSKGVTWASWPVAEPDTASEQLIELVKERFGGQACAELLMVLAALTYWTPRPVSLRIVGDAAHQGDVAELIQGVLGKSGIRLTSITGDGLLSIEKIHGSGCVLLDGHNIKKNIRPVLFPLIAGKTTRVLDGSPTGWPRDRQVSTTYSWLILNADNLSDPEFLSHLITLRLAPGKDVMRIGVRRKLSRWSVTAKARRRPFDIRAYLPESQTAIAFPDQIVDATSKIDNPTDLHRLEALFSLAGVWRALSGARIGGTVHADLGDIETILHIMEAAGVEDHRVRLSRQATDCLVNLRKKHYQKKQISIRGAKYQDAGSRNVKGNGGSENSMTFYSVQQLPPYRNVSVDAVRLWMLELEQAGLLEQVGKEGRKVAFRLTKRGMDWKPRNLAQSLRHMVGLSRDNSEKNNFGLQSPTVGDSGL